MTTPCTAGKARNGHDIASTGANANPNTDTDAKPTNVTDPKYQEVNPLDATHPRHP